MSEVQQETGADTVNNAAVQSDLPLEDAPPADIGVEADTAQSDAVETDEQKNERVRQDTAKRSEKKQRSFDKRVAELMNDKFSERKRAEELAGQNARLIAMLESKKTAPEASTGTEPKLEQYTDYNEYHKAFTEFHSRKAAKTFVDESIQKTVEQQQQRWREQEQHRVATAYAARAAEASKTLPDFSEVMEDASEVQVPNSVLEMIGRMPDGPVIAYHMIKNRALAEQFQNQPAYMHGILLGQLSASLKATTAVSKAPPPGKTASSKASSSNEPPEDADAYMDWARRQKMR